MPLNEDDITNIERGIDAAIETILSMAQVTSTHIATKEGVKAAGPIIGFIQALQEHRYALANKALINAFAKHPAATSTTKSPRKEPSK
jgi:hypothetical protein